MVTSDGLVDVPQRMRQPNPSAQILALAPSPVKINNPRPSTRGPERKGVSLWLLRRQEVSVFLAVLLQGHADDLPGVVDRVRFGQYPARACGNHLVQVLH